MDKRELDDELLERDREIRRRREQKKRLRRRQMILNAVGCAVVLAMIVGLTTLATNLLVKDGKPKKKTETESESMAVETETEDRNAKILEEAALLAAGYDYDAAIEKIKSVSGYELDEQMTAAVMKYTTEKAACVAVDVDTVPHIFYHSLVNDPSIAFSASVLGQSQADGMNAWMTTVDEFDKITQKMYDNGYVFVRLRDLVVETKDANGNVTFTRNENLMLPPGKKPVVLSVDDLSYYHSYEKASYPDKLVLDANGDVKCHYVKPDGTEAVGDFDVVPRLNSFLEKHPDGAYRGARGMIALTGYNGVLGYRTDVAYKTGENLSEDQSAWLTANPGFDWDREVSEATKVANAVKESGWEFASHTWGHLSVTNKTVDELKTDNDKWVNTVQNIVGPTDIIIFAHGNDIGDWHDYSADNEKFNFYKSAGYNFFCNVDGSVPYWVQIRENYVRQGRINLDGYMLYRASQGQTDVINDMFDAKEVFDSSRPTPVTANGMY
ncbi:MAG: polysaccharide deacetylase [Hominisplanchenecus sp.]